MILGRGDNTDIKINNALTVLRRYCKSRKDCFDCPLFSRICAVNNIPPYYWENIDWNNVEHFNMPAGRLVELRGERNGRGKEKNK